MNKWLQKALFTCFLSFIFGFNTEVKAQDTLSAFHLVAPSDSTIWGVSQFCQGSRTFKWQSSVPSVPAAVGYSLSFYLPNQPNLPAWTWPATGALLDTFALIPEDSINAFLLRMGSSLRQNSHIAWKVTAENDSTKLKRSSENQFIITFLPEVDSLGIPALLGPVDSLALQITRVSPLQLAFSWRTAFFNIVNPINPTVYQLEFDTISTFNNPVSVLTTSDTSVSIDRGALDTLAINSGISRLNQQKMIYWRVVANQCGISFVNSRISSLRVTRIDEQIQPFSLITPTFGQSINIRENTNSTILFNWTSPVSNTSTLPIQAELLIDNLSGDFSQPWLNVSIPVGDTQLLMNSGIIKQKMLNSGVGFNVNTPYKWAVRVSNGITQRISGNVNLIYFERKVDSISRFVTVLPFDSLRVEIPQSGSISNTFAWQPTNHSLGDTVKYKWKFWTLNSTAQTPLIEIESGQAGLQNALTLSVSRWNAILDSAGIGLNQIVEGNWAVEASAGGVFKWSDSVRYLRFVRVIDSLSSFDFIAPLNGTTIQLAQLTNQTLRIRWNKSVSLRQHPVKYTLKIDTIGSSTNTALFTVQILNDTVYAIGNAQLNALLQATGVGVGGSRLMRIMLDASAGSQQKSTTSALDIIFQRVQDSIGAFNLVSPAANSAIRVGNNLPAIELKWRKPAAFPDSLSYRVLFDAPSGNFSAPIFDEFAGSDTSFTISGGKLDSLLTNLGVIQGQSYPLKWAILATVGTQTRRSSIFSLNLTRFIDTLSVFNLLSPSDSAFLVLTNNPPTTINLRWNSSRSSNLTPVSYKCYWDIPSGNFSNPFFTKSSGSDTALTITNTEMASALLTLGAIPDTGTYLWTVVAESGPLALQAKSRRLVRIVWNLTTAVDDLQAQIHVFPNPVTDKVNIQANLQGSWAFSLLDLAGKVWKKGVIDFDRGLGVLPISEANSGLYFLQLCKDQTCRTVKIVKQ